MANEKKIKPLREIVLDVLAEFQDVNLSSDAARQTIADHIVRNRTKEIEKYLMEYINGNKISHAD